MLTITKKEFKSNFAYLAVQAEIGASDIFSTEIDGNFCHNPQLSIKKQPYGEWIISLRVSTVICGEPFTESTIQLCFLSHGVERAIEALDSLGIELA